MKLICKDHLVSCTLILIVFFIGIPTVSNAEESGAIGIEEVVVTARRREETAQSVPIPITAMTGEEMRERAANDLTDISRITPNMDYQKSSSNRGAAQVFLRSIGQVNWSPTQDPKVGVYLDGVYLGRPQGAVFDIMDLERIEVLRGPQGTLFGRNTTAGLVHVITAKPTDEFEAQVQLGGGNDGQLNAGAVLNIPITDTLATRFSFQHRESDGYVKNNGADTDWNDENSQMFRGSALWTPTDSFDALLMFDYQRVREHPGLGTCEWAGPDNGADILDPSNSFGLQSAAFIFGVYDEIRNTCNDTSPYSSGENDPDKATTDSWGLNFTFNWDFDFATLTSITAYREMDDLNDSWGWASDKVGTASYLEVLGYGENPTDQISQEFRLTGGNENFDWVGGVYYFEEESTNTLNVPLFRGVTPPDCAVWPIYCFDLVPGAPQFGTLGDAVSGLQLFGSRIQAVNGKNSSVAAFGEVTWRFIENWSVTAGLRYTEDTRKFYRSQVLSPGVGAFQTDTAQLDPTLVCPRGGTLMDDTLAGISGPMTCFQEAKFDEVTPRVIFSYDASDNVMLYGGWSKGYSSGGFNQDVRMRPFKPELSDNWEIGMKSTLADSRVQLNLTGFFNNYKNQQITVGRTVDNQPTADLINAQKAELWGIEGDLQWVPAEGWLLMGSFGWIDGEYQEFTVVDNATGPPPDNEPIFTVRDLSDTTVVRGAPYTFSLSAAYTHYFNGGGDLTGQIGWAHRGRTYNTLETHDSSRQKAYGLMDGRLTWLLANGSTSLSLWGRNLLDKEYYPSAIDLTAGLSPDDPQVDGTGGQTTGTNTKYWGEPRRFGLELRHVFN
jgi:iron complex outermembrane receptor protein